LRVGLYLGIWRPVWLIARLLWRIEIVGQVPPGACIVAANHESVLDPPLLALTTRRPLRFLAKEELWSNRFGAWVMESLGAVPVARGREGYVAIDQAVKLIRAGELVAIFPEGTVKGGTWTRGAARLALGTGAPLVPVRIVGTARALSRGRVGLPKIRIVVGEPISVEHQPPTVAAARELTRLLQERVESL
jgi:1-acyl-sn-glycerol-3-phosphate acyltransferase